jgi:hypothetical protein
MGACEGHADAGYAAFPVRDIPLDHSGGKERFPADFVGRDKVARIVQIQGQVNLL